ncbi:uncharacterized protein LOC123475399 [Daphnia magna]|uniref:uncharacterized protein LOC123475399 n=1 Tax=Daphnia magna TaxID=35525 RepID=UPI001E1BD918|nr:uncharacterized protein LOC123475399 [Daphnia magna]
MRQCRCEVGRCARCVCVREGQQCDENCLCFPERCTNRGVEHFQDAKEEVEILPAAMDPNALNAALSALAAKQQLQQQQMQQHQNLLTALTNRLLAVPAPGPPVVPPVPTVVVRAVLDVDVKYSGSTGESIQDWLQMVNRKALAENWVDGDKRRAAISSLFGKALTWQEEIGVNLIQWNDWINGIRGAFELQLTESQWQAIVEGRKQLPDESGSTYVLDKVKLCHRRAVPLTDAELIPFLIRGLLHPGIQSVMMGNPPISVNAFLIEIRRLESISDSPVGSSASKETEKIYEKTPEKTRSTDSLFQAMEALTSQVAVLTHTVNRPSSPDFLG